MADPIDPPENQDPPETPTLEQVIEVPVADLTDEQKEVIVSNAETLTDEQKETYKDILTPPDNPRNPDDINPETRTPAEVKKEKKKEEDEDDPDDEEIDPEDEKTISKIVDKKVGDKLAKLQQIENQTEVNAYVTDHPEFAKYQSAALKYMNHPAYANIPVQNIMAIVASKDLLKMGAEKERAAAKKVNETKNPGGTAREPGKGKVDWATATDDEFAAQHAKALGQEG